jgi:hypothetical protein
VQALFYQSRQAGALVRRQGLGGGKELVIDVEGGLHPCMIQISVLI